RYLAFVGHAFDADARTFRNFMSYSRQWLEHPSPDDCHGRALWALGAVIGRSQDRSHVSFAENVFEAAVEQTETLPSPRAWAYTLLGIAESQRDLPVAARLVDRLMLAFRAASTPSWLWFEDRLSYCNARLSQALVVMGARMQNDAAVAVGLRSLGWLYAAQSERGTFAPIGSSAVWIRGQTRPDFDQQPVEAGAMTSACLDAWRVSGDRRWLSYARESFAWFLGKNALGVSLYDEVSGGCRDGLHPDRANENQGAESTISFLQALHEIRATEPRTQSMADEQRVVS
ncbi:MAG TPA: hypothetical protein VGH87_00030, partial [Polyangiaceae bacterium]